MYTQVYIADGIALKIYHDESFIFDARIVDTLITDVKKNLRELLRINENLICPAIVDKSLDIYERHGMLSSIFDRIPSVECSESFDEKMKEISGYHLECRVYIEDKDYRIAKYEDIFGCSNWIRTRGMYAYYLRTLNDRLKGLTFYRVDENIFCCLEDAKLHVRRQNGEKFEYGNILNIANY
jgi:hypothetical protein